MNVFNFIEQSLHGIKGVPSGDVGSVDGFFEGSVSYDSLPIPLRQCEFVMRTSLSPNDIVFTSKLSLPEVGVSWTNNSDINLPIPSVDVKYAQVSSIIPRSFRGNLMNFYTRQFRNGLIAVDIERPTIHFDVLKHDEADYSDGLTSAVQSIVSKIQKTPSIGYDNGYGEFVVGSEMFVPYCTITKAWFGQPKFSTNPSSNDLIEVSMDIAFEDIIYNVLV